MRIDGKPVYPENEASVFLRTKYNGGCFGCLYCKEESCMYEEESNVNYGRKVSQAMICQFYREKQIT
ncbi:MAG: hypothetical protein H7A25_08415 [Leptospiraceae bacterium]|nr:hypothetical protein [Leptospiraceae bacterium]MCP5499911.1 hypothetical protein [Leptospiraceae bacterium]